ncbi:hypothetical protein O181_027337 [Austropuccinia psidii MF-1]|uniref:Chromo domain-containing protein n=1 Tax=Austropuccinia psidii MF-1 TaxID=1389203 RepID=A0A9Q3CSF8_9BASI|nr:hypothetical protein [Austropuccinia psidii MF-1]
MSERWLGPFPILKKVSTNAYHLKLPLEWKSIHPVFHISLLEPVKTSTILNRHKEPPTPIIIEEEEELEVFQILDTKLRRGKLWYLVEWKGFSQDPERSTWEATENLKNFPKLFEYFLLYILKIQDPILQEIDYLWCLVGRGITKRKSHPWYAPLEVFYPCCFKHHLCHSVSTLQFLDTDLCPGFQHHFQNYGHFHLGKWTILFLILLQVWTLSNLFIQQLFSIYGTGGSGKYKK